MDFRGGLNRPKREPARRRNEEQAVVPLLKPETEAREAQRHAPALDGEQALVVPGHDVDELGVFGLKVVVEAIEARIG